MIIMLAQRLVAVLAFGVVYSCSEAKTFAILDPITDLEWKRQPLQTTTKSIVFKDVTRSTDNFDEEHPSGTTLEAFLLNPAAAPDQQLIHHEDNIGNNHYQQQLAASHLLSQLTNLPQGRRRLDDYVAVTPLASNQQWRANEYRESPLTDADYDDVNNVQGYHRRPNYIKTKADHQQQQPVTRTNLAAVGRRNYSGERQASSRSPAGRKMSPLNNNNSRRQMAASRQQRRSQSRMGNANNYGKDKSIRKTPISRVMNKEDESTPSDDEIFNDEDNDGSLEPRSDSSSEESSHDDEYDEPADDSSLDRGESRPDSNDATMKRARRQQRRPTSGRGGGRSKSDRQRSNQAVGRRYSTSVSAAEAAEAIRYNENEQQGDGSSEGGSGYDDESDANSKDDLGQLPIPNTRIQRQPQRQQYAEGVRELRALVSGGREDSADEPKDSSLNYELGVPSQQRLDDEAASDDDESSSASQLRQQQSSSDTNHPQQHDLQAAAGHHHGHHHGHYYQYVEVPKKKAWKFGFKRGNHKHTISRHEKGHKNKFHSAFKWHAKEKCKKKEKCESKGKMTWHYEHHDKKHHP